MRTKKRPTTIEMLLSERLALVVASGGLRMPPLGKMLALGMVACGFRVGGGGRESAVTRKRKALRELLSHFMTWGFTCSSRFEDKKLGVRREIGVV